MAGYKGYSMSNNAVIAYECGEKPYSKWTKADILEDLSYLIKEDEIELKCDFAKIKKLPADAVKDLFLRSSSWHHTSSYYNKTVFFEVVTDRLETLTNDEIDVIIQNYKKEKTEKQSNEPKEEKWRCSFLEWSGSRRHPKATTVVEEGIIKGDWFIRADGTKKKTSANGFCFLEKLN